MRTILLYSAARLVLFLAALGVLYPIAGISIGTVVLAIVISALLSYVLLGRIRQTLVSNWMTRVEQRRLRKGRRPDVDTDAEDTALDNYDKDRDSR